MIHMYTHVQLMCTIWMIVRHFECSTCPLFGTCCTFSFWLHTGLIKHLVTLLSFLMVFHAFINIIYDHVCRLLPEGETQTTCQLTNHNHNSRVPNNNPFYCHCHFKWRWGLSKYSHYYSVPMHMVVWGVSLCTYVASCTYVWTCTAYNKANDILCIYYTCYIKYIDTLTV